MEINKKVIYTVVILSAIALFVSIFVGIYAYNTKADSIDLREIAKNSVLITSLQDELKNTQNELNDIQEYYSIIDDLDCSCDIDEDDLDDLEDDLKKYCRNRIDDECDFEDGTDGVDGIDGKDWSDMSIDEFNCIVDNRWDYNNTMDCLNTLL